MNFECHCGFATGYQTEYIAHKAGHVEKQAYKNVNVEFLSNGNISIRETMPGKSKGTLVKVEGSFGLKDVLASQKWDMEVTFTKKEKPFVPGFYQEKTDPRGVTWWLNTPLFHQELYKRVNVTGADE